ncbi:MAG: hypothetical protein P8141_08095 [Gammaproteobacteria bacterium]
MKRVALCFAVLVGSVLLLTACLGPKTPQEVTRAFWEAVLNNDASDAVKYSTLTEARYYDGFSKDWSGFKPSWGKVTIEGNEASVVSTFSSPANSSIEGRRFVTYLVLRSEGWKVDYDRTKVSVNGGAFGRVYDHLGQLSDDLSMGLQSYADTIRLEMDRMSRELEQLSNSLSQQAKKGIGHFAEELRNSIEELKESINRALKEDDKDLSDKDRRILQEVSADLDHDDESLSEPTVQAISDSSRNVGRAQLRLESIESPSADKYKKEWRELTEKVEKTMRKIMDELSTSAKGREPGPNRS